MSGIAGIFNVPKTPDQWMTWATVHAAHHRDINRRIYELSPANAKLIEPEYILDPINFYDISNWQDQHQIAHQHMDAALGIQGYDLTGVDFKNDAVLSAWIDLHAEEHYQASNILLIG